MPIELDPTNPLPFGRRQERQSADEQRNEFEFINELNELTAVEYPQDQDLRARIRAYELAFRMQSAVPEAVDLTQETAATADLYGLEDDATKLAGQRLLAARRLVERGVRFVQVYPSSYGVWDSHQKLKENHTRLCATIDKPVAGLIHDLKQRRSDGGRDGRLLHRVWPHARVGAKSRGQGWPRSSPQRLHRLARRGRYQKGEVHGETDELGYHALGDGHYVTDLHATVLHLLGLDNRSLEIPGRKRLEIDHGRPIHEILI
ncbi:MAG: DUF1501 domain-containing protein [Planctomycetaceae bacterium]